MTDITTITESQAAAQLAARYLRSPAHGWSIGIPGAIGEFMYDAGEPVRFDAGGRSLSAVTARGAIAITLPAESRCVALESPAECSGGTNQIVAFCVPEELASAPARDVLTELGPDQAALAAGGRDEILFDLGLGSALVQFCVRSGDATLLAVLRSGTGRSIFAHDNPAFAALRDASPVRVVTSVLGRVEVLQTIPEQGGASPRGPHTHLLPGLLKRARPDDDHGVPRGMVAPLTLYPEHPRFDKYGEPTPFNNAAHEDFQRLLARYGAPAALPN
jgi:hypothetical protein